jgi:phosphatidylserine/phosphatidylglycerophosphate/cardiolipin synthase-like enzyme
MHAKVVISDRKRAFVTSANLTSAAHARNIEVGTIFEDKQPAERLAGYFDGLVRSGAFVEF